MLIRLATRADVPAIVAISNWAAVHTPANFAIAPESIESWTHSFDHSHRMYPWLVATEGEPLRESVLGFAKASAHKGRCAYAWTAELSVYVQPEHHGRGIGTALYTQLIPALKSQGYVTLMAGITTPNPASERLHESFGFRQVAVFERMGWKFSRWHNVSYFQAVLSTDPGEPPPIRAVGDVLPANLLQGRSAPLRPQDRTAT